MAKDCNACGAQIPADKRSDAKYCSSACGNNARGQKWRDNNAEVIAAKNAKDNSDVARRMLYRSKSRAKKKGLDFNLEISDIQVPDVCPVLGITLNFKQGKKGYHPDSPSLDRIDPSKGYVKGNVQVMSARANLLKNDATVEELQQVIEFLLKGNS
tara:strand:- start:3760 stop:4227 length:468 start_codon:yes stop_codon:yes gene_type:complete